MHGNRSAPTGAPEPASTAIRSLAGRIGANTRWSRVADRTAATAAARAKSPSSITYWEMKVDPDRHLDPEIRNAMARNAMQCHFERLALKSARARSKALALADEVEAIEAAQA